MRISDWSSDVCSSDLPAHADDVLVVAIAALNADAGEDEGTLHVHVARGGVIGRRQAVADVGLMRLGADGEEVFAVPEHRGQDGGVRRMRVAGVRSAEWRGGKACVRRVSTRWGP